MDFEVVTVSNIFFYIFTITKYYSLVRKVINIPVQD